MTSITDGTTTITPVLIDGYKSARPSRNIKHRILGTNVPAYSLKTAGLRTGNLHALFLTRTDAAALETMLAKALPFTLTDPDEATLNMTFVVEDSSDIEVELDDETRDAWWVMFQFDEVGT